MDRRVLILGGTGTIGKPLIDEYEKAGDIVIDITSRKDHNPCGKTNYIKGDAHDTFFLENILQSTHYDVIVDFMIYEIEELKDKLDLFLRSCDQYIFMSTARVYAEKIGLISENDPLLIDSGFGDRNNYSIKKAKEEELIKQSGKNWTILRPSITYSVDRLQMPIDEKEAWLYRALHGKSIVFPEDCRNIITTMTYAADVAKIIAQLSFNKLALGEVFNVCGADPISWGDVLDCYQSTLKKNGIEVSIQYVDGKKASKAIGNIDQYQTARSISRVFDNSKLHATIGEFKWTKPVEGLSMCLNQFLQEEHQLKKPLPKNLGYYDRLNHQFTSLSIFGGWKAKLKYLLKRIGL